MATAFAPFGNSTYRGSHALPALTVAIIMAIILAVGLTIGPLYYVSQELTPQWTALGLLAAIGLWLERLRARRIALAIKLFALFIALSSLTALDSAVLATSAMPMADNLLAAIDARLFFGFDWPAIAHLCAPHITAMTLLSLAYASLTFQPALLLGWLSAQYREAEGWRFVTAWGLALLFSVLIFPWVPAVGGYVYYGIAATETPGVHVAAAWQAAVLLDHLRDGSLLALDRRSLDGIITMPSFHAAGAVLLGWGFWQIRALRLPLTALNAAMFLSAVPIGGHYVVDVVVGTAVAIVSIRLSGVFYPVGLSPSYPHRGHALPA